jgi:hypothetical protein
VFSSRLWADGVGTLSYVRKTSPVPPTSTSGQRTFRVRRRRVRAASFALFDASARVYMVTFTFPAGVTEQERAEKVRRFARFLSKETAAGGGVTGYVWVFERHRSGALHAHFLVGLSVRRRRLWVRSLVAASERWTGAANGLDVRLVRGARGVSAYVSKYVSKSASVFTFRAYGYGGVASFHVRSVSLPFPALLGFSWGLSYSGYTAAFLFPRRLFYAPLSYLCGTQSYQCGIGISPRTEHTNGHRPKGRLPLLGGVFF